MSSAASPGRLNFDDRRETTMRYMLLLYLDERPEDPEFYRAIRAYRDECVERGAFVGAAPLHEPHTATTVRVRDGQTLSTDGPFAETAEWLGGYFMLDCDDLDEALELAARCPNAGIGSVEVRPVMEVQG
jgi:hypothetical protein